MNTPSQERAREDLTFVGACHGCIALAPSQVEDFYLAQGYVAFAAVMGVLCAVFWLI